VSYISKDYYIKDGYSIIMDTILAFLTIYTMLIIGTIIVALILLRYILDKIYAFLETKFKRITMILKNRWKLGRAENTVDLLLSAETLLYIIIFSFYISLFIIGCCIFRVLEPKILIVSIVYFSIALLTIWVRKRPWNREIRFLKIGLLLINPLIIVQGYLIISKAILTPVAPKDIVSVIDSILTVLTAKTPQSLLPDIAGFFFFLGFYFFLRYVELHFNRRMGAEEKHEADWGTIVVISLMRLAFIIPIIAFTILLAFDFISVFHSDILEKTRLDEGVIAITSSITAFIIEVIRTEATARTKRGSRS